MAFRVTKLLFSFFLSRSLRVSLDLGKVVYSWMMMHDKDIPGTVVRSSTIPEELGRIGYLLSDKTGTLTENEMVLLSFMLLYFGFFFFFFFNYSDVKVSGQDSGINRPLVGSFCCGFRRDTFLSHYIIKSRLCFSI